MAKKYDYNLIAIGAGSGGLVSAYIGAAVKAKVALIEKNEMGGDCLNTGCVPSKSLLKVAKVVHQSKKAADFGLEESTIDFDFAKVMDHVQSRIEKVAPHDSVERYSKLGVDCYQGAAEIVSPHEVQVNGKSLITKNIVIATGGRPALPGIKGIEGINYVTSDTFWRNRIFPKKFLVIGGGPIGCELAQAMNRLGSKVVIANRGPRILAKEDSDVSDFLKRRLEKEGISVLCNYEFDHFEPGILHGKHNGIGVEIPFDLALVATGRKPNLEGFGAENIDLKVMANGQGFETDSYLRTNHKNIFVCGDVEGSYQFTHTASHQAWYCAVNALFGPLIKFKASYDAIPWCTFTDPEVAHVGLNETQAYGKNIPYEITTYGIDDLDRAIADVEDYGYVKVLTEPGKDKILGATIVGTHAGELIHEFILAMKHGLGLNKILGTIHIYPTHSEAVKYAAGQWKRKQTPRWILSLLKKYHEILR